MITPPFLLLPGGVSGSDSRRVSQQRVRGFALLSLHPESCLPHRARPGQEGGGETHRLQATRPAGGGAYRPGAAQ